MGACLVADTLIETEDFVTGMGNDTRSNLNNWLTPFLEELGYKKRRTWALLYLRSLLKPGGRKSLHSGAGD